MSVTPRILLSVSVTLFGAFDISAAPNWIDTSPTGADFNVGANWSTGAVPTTGNSPYITNGTQDGESVTSGISNMSSGTISTGTFGIGDNGSGAPAGATGIGQLNQSGGSLTLTSVRMGRGANSLGVWSMTNGATATLNQIRLGMDVFSAVAIMTVDGPGTVVNSITTSNNPFVLGGTGTATVTLRNSGLWTHTGAQAFGVGVDNNALTTGNTAAGTGNLHVESGAALNISDPSSSLLIGRSNGMGGIGTVTVNGGTIGSSLSPVPRITMGISNRGSVFGEGQAGTGILNVKMGSVNANQITMNQGGSTVNLDGGTLTVGASGIIKSSDFGNGTVNFNGGVLQASASSPGFITKTGNGTLDLLIMPGGAKIDSNSFEIMIDQFLTGAGDLTKLGQGTLSLAGLQAYTGNTLIAGGTLAIDAPYLDDSSSVAISSGSIFNLATGSTDTIRGLLLNGVSQTSGVYGAVGSGAQFEISSITGSGRLNVTNVPEPSVALHCFVVLGGVLGLRRRPSVA